MTPETVAKNVKIAGHVHRGEHFWSKSPNMMIHAGLSWFIQLVVPVLNTITTCLNMSI